LAEDHHVPIFEDDCYADLIWDGRRPPALTPIAKPEAATTMVRFPNPTRPPLPAATTSPAWAFPPPTPAPKPTAGPAPPEQMVLAEFCTSYFTEHVPKLTRGLRAKLETLMEALAEQFGTSAEFDDPKGGIFLWVKLPDAVDTQKLAQAALAAGVAINPGRD